jgi:hypothetical protein
MLFSSTNMIKLTFRRFKKKREKMTDVLQIITYLVMNVLHVFKDIQSIIIVQSNTNRSVIVV